MKKLIAVLLVFVMAVSMVACTPVGGNEADAGKETTGGNAAQDGTLVLDEKGNGHCPVCDKTVTWIKFDGTEQFPGISEHLHFYLAEDVTYGDDISINMIYTINDGKVCFHFNNHTLTTGGRFWSTGEYANAEDETNEFNLIAGKGGVIYTGSYDNGESCIQHWKGTLNIYGGTFTSQFAEGVEERPFFQMTRTAVFKDTVVNGEILLNSIRSMLELQGSATVNGKISIPFDERAHKVAHMLLIDKTWTGAATLEVAEGTLDSTGVMDTTRYFANGDFTGSLKLSTGEELVHGEGKLVKK